MSNQDKSTEASAKPTELTRRNSKVWVRFLLVILAVLALDLGLKVWSFENIANTPIRLELSEKGGPQVLIPVKEDGVWRVVSTVGPMGEPPRIPRHDPTVVIPNGLNLQLTLNTGAVFGTGQGGRPIFIIVSLIAVVVIVFLIYRSPPNALMYHLALAMILGGALGNLYDRVRFAAVRDMLHILPGVKLPFGLSYPGGADEVWPWIFNPADVALVVGVLLVLVLSYLSDRKASKAKKKA